MVNLLNFAHPIMDKQLNRLDQLIGVRTYEVNNVPVQFDARDSFVQQVNNLLVEFEKEYKGRWKKEQYLVNFPSLNFITVLLLIRMHKWMGHYPKIIRIARDEKSRSPKFEVVEVIDLDSV
jgi:hypothetical protein